MKKILLILPLLFLFTGCALKSTNLESNSNHNKNWNSLFDSDDWQPINTGDKTKVRAI